MQHKFMSCYKYIISLVNLCDYGYSHIIEARAMMSKVKEIYNKEIGELKQDKHGGVNASEQHKVAYWLSSQSLAINAPHPYDITKELIVSIGFGKIINKDSTFDNDKFYLHLASKIVHIFNVVDNDMTPALEKMFNELTECIETVKHECPDCGVAYRLTSHNNFTCPNCEDNYEE